MKCIFPITLLFLMTSAIVAESANLNSSSTEQIILASSAMGEDAEEEKSHEEVPPVVPPLPNDPEASAVTRKYRRPPCGDFSSSH